MADDRKRVPARFWKSRTGVEPVRDWFQSLSREDRRTIGTDIAMVEFGWPVGMPTCRAMGGGLLEVRSDLEDKRTARVLFCFADGQMVLLHGFIKKSEKTPKEEPELARKRKREMEL
ncbi:MAG TPA: type II toxin-antitoxin system RelE/ParE family toxin [Longimicrobium sp.]|jgi:phage-related protein